jgi:hypothetical protein
MSNRNRFAVAFFAAAALPSDALASDYSILAYFLYAIYFACSALAFLGVWLATRRIPSGDKRALVRVAIACLLWTPVKNPLAGVWWPAPLAMIFDRDLIPAAVGSTAVATLVVWMLARAGSEYRRRKRGRTT